MARCYRIYSFLFDKGKSFVFFTKVESIKSQPFKEAEKMHQDEGKKSKTTSKPRYDVLLLAIGAAKRGCGKYINSV